MVLMVIDFWCLMCSGGVKNDENQMPTINRPDQSALIQTAVQQMTHGFVSLFERELDQVQTSLKEALYV